MYQLQIYTINKTKTNSNQSKYNKNKNNYLHNIIKAQQIKLLLQVDHIQLNCFNQQ